MNTTTNEILIHLQPLIGLKLTIARRAADLRNFQFGPIRNVEKGTVGVYSLHIQCPWRIEGPQGIITGHSDLWKPAKIDGDFDRDTWDFEKDGNLQDKLIGTLLGGYDPQTHSFVNANDNLIVEAVYTDEYGGANIALSGGYRLVLFPAGSISEDWRIFNSITKEPHFVIVGGRIEQDAESDA